MLLSSYYFKSSKKVYIFSFSKINYKKDLFIETWSSIKTTKSDNEKYKQKKKKTTTIFCVSNSCISFRELIIIFFFQSSYCAKQKEEENLSQLFPHIFLYSSICTFFFPFLLLFLLYYLVLFIRCEKGERMLSICYFLSNTYKVGTYLKI